MNPAMYIMAISMDIKTNWFYYVGRWLTTLCLHLLTRCEIKGKENIPRQGPFLVVANHIGAADPPLIAVCIDRKLRFMAKEELFHSPIIAYFVKGFGAFPVRRSHVDRQALKEAERTLNAGWGLVMFPEGKRSRTGGLTRAFPGSALIAIRNGVSILPVGITGTEVIDRGATWVFRRPRITLNIGKPFTLTGRGQIDKMLLSELADEVMLHIAELLPPDYRGYYADKVSRKTAGAVSNK